MSPPAGSDLSIGEENKDMPYPQDAGDELDAALKALAGLTTTTTPPHITSIREEVLRAIAAANIAQAERETLRDALELFEQEGIREASRFELLASERVSIMNFVDTVSRNAAATLESYTESLGVPGYNETAQTRLLAARLREIGAGCRDIFQAYQYGRTVITSPLSHR